MSIHLRLASFWVAAALLMTLSGCASTPKRNPLPPEYTTKAGIPGVPEARFWGDEWPTFAVERFATLTDADFRREFAQLIAQRFPLIPQRIGPLGAASERGGWTVRGFGEHFE